MGTTLAWFLKQYQDCNPEEFGCSYIYPPIGNYISHETTSNANVRLLPSHFEESWCQGGTRKDEKHQLWYDRSLCHLTESGPPKEIVKVVPDGDESKYWKTEAPPSMEERFRGVQWWHRAVVMKDLCIYVGVSSPSSRIKWVEPVAFTKVRTRWSLEVDRSLSFPCKHQCSCKDAEFHGQKWPSWSECEADLTLKHDMKKFLIGDKGWRTHAQAPDNIKSGTRQGRVDRSLAQQALYRIFVERNFGMPYPFESCIPQGRQYVPRIRGFVMTAEAEARVDYYANRIFRADKKDEITPNGAVNSIIPTFFNQLI